MKKFAKFLAGVAGVAAVVGGVFYALNKKAEKEAPVEDEDFTEDFEDPFFEDENRSYTSIPVPAEEEVPAEEAPAEEAPEEEKTEE